MKVVNFQEFTQKANNNKSSKYQIGRASFPSLLFANIIYNFCTII